MKASREFGMWVIRDGSKVVATIRTALKLQPDFTSVKLTTTFTDETTRRNFTMAEAKNSFSRLYKASIEAIRAN